MILIPVDPQITFVLSVTVWFVVAVVVIVAVVVVSCVVIAVIAVVALVAVVVVSCSSVPIGSDKPPVRKLTELRISDEMSNIEDPIFNITPKSLNQSILNESN